MKGRFLQFRGSDLFITSQSSQYREKHSRSTEREQRRRGAGTISESTSRESIQQNIKQKKEWQQHRMDQVFLVAENKRRALMYNRPAATAKKIIKYI